VVNAVAAWYLFGEALTVTRIIGIAVIIGGVYLITRS
jgi:multidrug transporter EmrE-like cation transporter